MNFPRSILFLQLATALALGQSANPSQHASISRQPEALVRSLYDEIVARPLHGLQAEKDMKFFAPHLSKGLLHKINLARACSADWERQSPDPKLTTNVVSGFGLFSGLGSSPESFQIEKTEPEKDGSLRVYATLKFGTPPARPWSRRVAAVVMREDGYYAVDDVIYVNDSIWDRPEDKPTDRRLSEYLSGGCNGPRWSGLSLPKEPALLAQSLYQQVVARRPVGIPSGEDWKIFAPYMSKTLLQRIDSAMACGDDWDRQFPDPNLKPEIGWLELGLFSGGDDESELNAFKVERAQSEEDGSYRVYVRLTWGRPPDGPWVSHVAIVLVEENGRFVVDDVLYLKEVKNLESESLDGQLSQSLSEGCNGPHWVGFGEHRENLTQQK
jgi:hypothetical protein